LSEEDVQAKFIDYPFRESILKDIQAAGFETPTPIQAGCIPLALEGKDVIGLAQTGTGKTAAFALPIIHRMARKMDMGALVLAPTRELAKQISDMFEELGQSSGIRVATVVGGIPIKNDWKALTSWPNVLVATPGRLIDHIESGSVVLDGIECLVIDEADRMHDMGFIPQIRRILEAVPKDRQTLMLSATMPKDVERIARRHMRDPERVQIGRRSAPAERAEQQLFKVHESQKTPLLIHLLDESDGRVLVFVRTKRGVDKLARTVRRRGYRSARIHGDRGQEERTEAMDGFRDGKHRVLIATDIAARGLDIENIEHVINYDFPHAAEDYVHRIGRTARVAAKGLATSFVTRRDRRHLSAVENLVGEKLQFNDTPDGIDGNGNGGGRKTRSKGRRSRGKRSHARA
jgi:ATP-dependent RNA helicase RhlE